MISTCELIGWQKSPEYHLGYGGCSAPEPPDPMSCPARFGIKSSVFVPPCAVVISEERWVE